jgi:deoxyribonuclease-1
VIKMRIIILSILLISLSSPLFACGNQKIKSFYSAKKKISSIYAQNAKTFYCECQYAKKDVNASSCGYVVLKSNKRSRRIEWEHVVPASRFGREFLEWKNGHDLCGEYKGRRCARKVNLKFRLMEADLYNLVPAIGEINQRRSNYTFGVIPGEPRWFGECDFEIQGRMAEPRQGIRGDIARIYFYMAYAYPGYIVLTEDEKKLFTEWNKSDPPDAWEIKRAAKIKEIQGNSNPFLSF